MSLRVLGKDERPATPQKTTVEASDELDDPGGHLEHARQAVEAGQLDAALAIYTAGAELAAARRDRICEERMRCSRAGVLVVLERGEEATADLRRILMSSRSTANRFLAAYNLSCHYDRAGVAERAHFYAKQSLDHARRSGRRDFLAQAHNQLANLLVLESYFDAASAAYQEALGYLPAAPSVARSLVLANLGYCRVVSSELPDAFRLLFAGLRMMRHLDAGTWEVVSRVRLSLCLAYLEIGRLDRARCHGETALAAAEAHGDRQAIKHSLYLLGEVEKSDGSHLAAFCHFSRLQREFYPESHGVTDMLMVTTTHKLINLMA